MTAARLQVTRSASIAPVRSPTPAVYRKPARPAHRPLTGRGADPDAVLRALRGDPAPEATVDAGYGDIVAAARAGSPGAARSLADRAGDSPSRLTVTPPADVTEIEADRVADHIMRMPAPDAAAPPEIDGTCDGAARVNRMCTKCADEDERRVQRTVTGGKLQVHRKRLDPEDEVHGKLSGAAPAIGADLAGRITGMGPGDTLPASERAFFEPRFGHDFSGVRIHRDGAAADVAGELNARAFTRGSHIAFGAGEYAPGTDSGRRLLAHELTHVVQQGRAPDGPVQRDLATPEPATPPAAQPALTKAQIDAAIRYNRDRYDKPRTEQLQDLIGTPQTGTWSEDDILAVADLQERYGLHKDGMVGPRTFVFLDNETRREGLAKTDANCLLAFSVAVDPPTVGPVAAGHRSITGHFVMRAQFSPYCRCGDYEYRQFIRGHWRRIRGGVVTDLGGTFTRQPAGGLTVGFAEDGDVLAAAVNYGHRDQPNEGTGNGYFDDENGATANQATGCHYRGNDTPGGPDAVLPGDVFDILVAFRGEIRRNGRVEETKHWTAINGRFPV